MGKRLEKNFFDCSGLDLAKNLLGKVFCYKLKGIYLQGVIDEVEYYHQSDPASHSYKGMTKRNEVMFEEAGKIYVYFIYGNYYCLNIVSGKAGEGEAILIRSMVPLLLSKTNYVGLNLLIKNRKWNANNINYLLNGPGKICEAFGINLDLNGKDLTKKKQVFLLDYNIAPVKILYHKRVGISKAKDQLLNFSYREGTIKL